MKFQKIEKQLKILENMKTQKLLTVKLILEKGIL